MRKNGEKGDTDRMSGGRISLCRRYLQSISSIILLTILLLYIYQFDFYKYAAYSNFSQNSSIIQQDLNDTSFIHPWPNDPICSHYVTRFGSNIPLTFLASYPRSGNTWTRYLLEGATGIFTGSIYNDNRLNNKFLGEKENWKSGRTLVVKVHPKMTKYSPTDESPEKNPVILILRNPIKSLTSFWDFSYASKKGHRNEAFQFYPNSTSYKSKEFRKHVTTQLKMWEETARNIIIMTKKLHVVFYENLSKHPLKEVRNMLKFMNLPVDEGRMKCIFRNLDGKAKRHFEHREDPFTKKEKLDIMKSVANIAGLLLLRGIEIPSEYKNI